MLGQFLDNPARYYQLNGRLCAVVHIRYKEMKINNQSCNPNVCWKYGFQPDNHFERKVRE